MARVAQPELARSTSAPRRRHYAIVAAVTLVALTLIALSELGVDLWPRTAGGSALPTVQARELQQIAQSPSTAASSQVSFLARAPDGGLVIGDRVERRILRFDANGTRLSQWGPTLGPDFEL